MRRLLLSLPLFCACLVGHAQAADADGNRLNEDLIAKTRPLTYALTLIGSPYKRGGTDPLKGVDCSGFVRHVYNDSTGITLPHNALQMSKEGSAVDKDALEPGDLVFFNTMKKPFSHVGIYLGDGRFVHAASSRTKRVTVSHLADRYWTKYYNGARRLSPERLSALVN